MKLKIFILLLAVCLVLIGCDSAETKNPASEPAQDTSGNIADDGTVIIDPIATGDIFEDFTFPEEIQGIVLPDIELTEEDYGGSFPEPVPVTKPAETEPENPAEETDPPEASRPVFDPDWLPDVEIPE